MPTYLVERFVPRAEGAELAGIARAVAAAARQSGPGTVRCVAVTLVPGDEFCYLIFEAVSIEAVRHLHEAAQLPFVRIVETLHLAADSAAFRP